MFIDLVNFLKNISQKIHKVCNYSDVTNALTWYLTSIYTRRRGKRSLSNYEREVCEEMKYLSV